MIRIAVVLTMVLLSACGKSSSKAPLGQYSEECTGAAPCATNLQCVNSVCTNTCQTSTQCQMYGTNSICVNGYCWDTCHDKSNCPNGLDCVQDLSGAYICKVLLVPQH